MTNLRKGSLAAFAVALMSIFAAQPAQSGPAELELLTSYIGSWQGQGVMQGGDFPEEFRCRLTVSKGTQAKINYAGRCSLVNMNISVTGTVAFDDKNRRYQAAMSSNAGFTGLAVGRQQGRRITFKLDERQTDKGGNDVRIGSILTLDDGNIIVDFQVEFNNSGQILTTRVPFRR
jgi:hypothetical protein